MPRMIALAMVLGIAPGISLAQAPSESEQRQACTGDAMKLCATEIPNRDKVQACLTAHRSEITPDCRSVPDGRRPDRRG